MGKIQLIFFQGGIKIEDNNMRNIVVLKSLPSNIVEEAIVVLRENKMKNPKIDEEKNAKQKDYILKEAEMVITNYLSNLEKKKEKNNKKTRIENKYRILKFVSILLAIVLIAMIFF